jgi:hypothetical protein
MPELKDQIRTYFESIAPPVQARPEPSSPWWRMRPAMAWVLGAAVVAVPTLLLWGLFGRGVEAEPTIPPATTVSTVVEPTLPPDTTLSTTTVPEATSTQPPTTTAAPVDTDTVGGWISIPEAPQTLAPEVQVWTGTELIVWGNATDSLDGPAVGMSYNPTTTTWRELAPGPGRRQQPAVVWTGSELLIWGGDGWDGEQTVLTNDGFSYNPTTDSWATIPEAPLSPRTYPFYVWTGEELIVWGGMVEIEEFLRSGTTGGAAYNPTTNTWRAMAEAPLGRRNPGVAVWTGTSMIIGGNGDQTDGDASWAAYNPATDSWTSLPDPPVRAGNVYDGVWTGTEVIFSIDTGTESGNRRWSELYAFNPETNQWRQTASPDGLLLGAGYAWTGEYLVYWGMTGFPTTVMETAYDPDTDDWIQLAPAPLNERFATGAVTALGPTTVIVWGGQGFGVESYPDGAILALDDPDSDDSPRADADLISLLFPLPGDLSRAADLPWDPGGVALGLGEAIIHTVDPSELVDPDTWTLGIDTYNGAVGPFSVLDAINRLAAIDDMQINEGPHDHCASPPKPAPPGYEGLRRVSVQPWDFDGCLQWWTIDLFLTDDGLIQAITYDFWEP